MRSNIDCSCDMFSCFEDLLTVVKPYCICSYCLHMSLECFDVRSMCLYKDLLVKKKNLREDREDWMSDIGDFNNIKVHVRLWTLTFVSAYLSWLRLCVYSEREPLLGDFLCCCCSLQWDGKLFPTSAQHIIMEKKKITEYWAETFCLSVDFIL